MRECSNENAGMQECINAEMAATQDAPNARTGPLCIPVFLHFCISAFLTLCIG
jgi:hypothetical protein